MPAHRARRLRRAAVRPGAAPAVRLRAAGGPQRGAGRRGRARHPHQGVVGALVGRRRARGDPERRQHRAGAARPLAAAVGAPAGVDGGRALRGQRARGAPGPGRAVDARVGAAPDRARGLPARALPRLPPGALPLAGQGAAPGLPAAAVRPRLPRRRRWSRPGNVYNRSWEQRLGADPAIIRTIYNGVDPAQFAKVENEPPVPTISWAGRIDPIKDLHTLLRAFAVVRRDGARGAPAAVRGGAGRGGGLPAVVPGPRRGAGRGRRGRASRAGSSRSGTPTPRAGSSCCRASPRASPTP